MTGRQDIRIGSGDKIPRADIDRQVTSGGSVSVRVRGSWFDVYPSGWVDGSNDRWGPHAWYLVRWELSDHEVESRGLEGGE